MRLVRSLLALAAVGALAPLPARADPTECAVWDSTPPPRNQPPLRRGHAAVLDAHRQRMLVYGANPTAIYGELLEFSLNGTPTWRKLEVAGPGPSIRREASVILDARRDRLVVFGGRTIPAGEILGDAWTLDLGTSPLRWTSLVPADGVAPGRRWGHSAIYDEACDRMVIHGGTGPTEFEPLGLLDDVWALSLGSSPTWTKLTPEGTPPPAHYEHSAMYDRRRGRMVVFGGYSPGLGDMKEDLRDLWTLTLDDAPRWTRTRPLGPRPSARTEASAGYDEAGDRWLIYGCGRLRSGARAPRSLWRHRLRSRRNQ